MKLEISRKAQVLGFLFHRERGGEAYLMKALRVFPGCSVSSPAVDTSAPPCRQPAGGEAPAGGGGGGTLRQLPPRLSRWLAVTPRSTSSLEKANFTL